MKKTNPRLKAMFMEIVDNQLGSNDPPETKETLNRLIAQGISKDNAKVYIAQAVCVEVWYILTNRTKFNNDRFVRNLRNLPDEPEE